MTPFSLLLSCRNAKYVYCLNKLGTGSHYLVQYIIFLYNFNLLKTNLRLNKYLGIQENNFHTNELLLFIILALSLIQKSLTPTFLSLIAIPETIFKYPVSFPSMKCKKKSTNLRFILYLSKLVCYVYPKE